MEKQKKLAYILLMFIIFLSILTQYYGSTDVVEYTGAAKFFAGEYNAKIRASHSMLYSFINAPFVLLFNSFLIMKIINLFFLILIIISMYYISKKNKRVLLLMLASPIIWYMSPWISPIQLSTLLFLWGFFFIKKFENYNNKSCLFYSGVLIGLSVIIWNTALFIILFFIICFFYNKNINNFVFFMFSILVGFTPLFILDQVLYGFPLYSFTKFLFGIASSSFFGTIYQGNLTTNSFVGYISFLIMLPFFGYTFFLKKFFKENKKTVIFITLSFIFFLVNPQIRYILFLWPTLILLLSKSLNKEQFKKQLIIFLIISLIVINPYLIQIKYSTNARELSSAIKNLDKIEINSTSQEEIILNDLEKIIEEYPNETFIVGNHADNYAELAQIYWGKDVKEFVSIQDYNIYLDNDSTIFEKKVKFVPKIQDRRQIWLAGGMDKNENDKTNYQNITLAIGIGEPIELEGFNLTKEYNSLYLSKKINV